MKKNDLLRKSPHLSLISLSLKENHQKRKFKIFETCHFSQLIQSRNEKQFYPKRLKQSDKKCQTYKQGLTIEKNPILKKPDLTPRKSKPFTLSSQKLRRDQNKAGILYEVCLKHSESRSKRFKCSLTQKTNKMKSSSLR